jgi:hypothetical protein
MLSNEHYDVLRGAINNTLRYRGFTKKVDIAEVYTEVNEKHTRTAMFVYTLPYSNTGSFCIKVPLALDFRDNVLLVPDGFYEYVADQIILKYTTARLGGA